MLTQIAPMTAAGAETLTAATGLFDLLDGSAARAAADRRLPRSTVDALKASHAFRMPMPASWGGPELPVTDQLLVFEELTYADGAAGWCAMIGCDAGYYSASLEDAVAREIWDDLDLITAGQSTPSGKAVRDGDGWKVSGRWAFGSGCTHADRIVGGAFLQEADGTPITDGGLPAWRTFVLPIDAVTIHDSWDPTGLAGTGSHDYSTDGAWVPHEHGMQLLEPGCRDGTLYALPWWFIVKAAAVPLGLARRALDELTTMSSGKLVFPELRMLDDLGHTHDHVARSRALIGAARTLLHDVVASAWEEVENTGELRQEGRADLRLAMTHATTTCRAAVDLCVSAATTSAIKRGSPIDRALRDIVTASQHIVVNDRTYGLVGRVLLGKPATGPMI